MLKKVTARTFSELRANFPNVQCIRMERPGAFYGFIDVPAPVTKTVKHVTGDSYAELVEKYGDTLHGTRKRPNGTFEGTLLV